MVFYTNTWFFCSDFADIKSSFKKNHAMIVFLRRDLCIINEYKQNSIYFEIIMSIGVIILFRGACASVVHIL